MSLPSRSAKQPPHFGFASLSSREGSHARGASVLREPSAITPVTGLRHDHIHRYQCSRPLRRLDNSPRRALRARRRLLRRARDRPYRPRHRGRLRDHERNPRSRAQHPRRFAACCTATDCVDCCRDSVEKRALPFSLHANPMGPWGHGAGSPVLQKFSAVRPSPTFQENSNDKRPNCRHARFAPIPDGRDRGSYAATTASRPVRASSDLASVDGRRPRRTA